MRQQKFQSETYILVVVLLSSSSSSRSSSSCIHTYERALHVACVQCACVQRSIAVANGAAVSQSAGHNSPVYPSPSFAPRRAAAIFLSYVQSVRKPRTPYLLLRLLVWARDPRRSSVAAGHTRRDSGARERRNNEKEGAKKQRPVARGEEKRRDETRRGEKGREGKEAGKKGKARTHRPRTALHAAPLSVSHARGLTQAGWLVMSHHIVTVCVVCVLCAAHVPCSAHTTNLSAVTSDNSTSVKNQSDPDARGHPFWSPIRPNETNPLTKNQQRYGPSNFTSNKHDAVRSHITRHYDSKNNNSISVTTDATSTDIYHKKGMTESFKGGGNHLQDNPRLLVESADVSDLNARDAELLERLAQVEFTPGVERKSAQPSEDSRNVNRSRLKRDVNESYFMRKIFEAYGDGTSITMEGFEKLIRKLGLLRLLADVSEDDGTDRNNRNFSSKGLHDTDSKNNKERCLNSLELLSTVAQDTHYATGSNSTTLPSWLFERVCPVLVYQLAAESSSERNGCIRVPENYKPVVPDDNFYTADDSRNIMKVWVYSTVSIFVISLSGLLGVAVIPIMGKTYYHHVLQFLVALAVGTLTGDAFIHLLPHAMMPSHQHDEHGESHEHEHYHDESSALDHVNLHSMNMWKGLVAMIGFVSFFFTEKALNVISEWRKHWQHKKKLPTRVRVMRESDGPNSNVVGEKLCKHKYSSYPYCYGEIASETQDNHHDRRMNHHERPPIIEEEKPLTSNCNSVTKIVTNDVEKKPKDDWRMDDPMMNAKKNADGADVSLNESESYTVILREHETKHHGHSHSHGHVHSAPESMSNVAWMVVMGDGLHNFTDGMAIGAAFSANIAGGFSTAIAVLCHELPHELGDFAVLLKAGMSTKQAVFYNLLSSLLCLFGMIGGILLGSAPDATSWVFAVAAGIFIYIALVDMVPELSSSHSAESGSRLQCIWQTLGLLAGLGIMLLIALYEHDLKHIFDN